MNDGAHRFVNAALVLVLIWIITYWVWNPRESEPGVTLDTTPAGLSVAQAETMTGLVGTVRVPEEQVDPADLEDPANHVDPEFAMTNGAKTQEDATPRDPLMEGSTPIVAKPAWREYTLRKNEDIMSLAVRVYGRQRHWQAISKFNPTVDPNDPKEWRAGVVIKLPLDPENVQGILVDAQTGEKVGEPTPPEPEVTEYRVGRGDTLSGIAKRLYGKASMWRVIRDANRDKVNSEGTNIRPGMVLKIPPAPRGGES